jgi:hypothetical protein
MPIFVGRRTVASERTPSVRLADPTVPSAIPGAIEEVGRLAGEVAGDEIARQRIEQEKQEKIDKALAKDQLLKDKTSATNAFVTYQNSLNDESNRLKSRKGLTAEGVRLEFDTFSKAAYTKINENLTTPGSQEMFFADSQLHDINARQNMAVYERDETFKGRDSSFRVAGAAAVKSGITDYQNPNTHAISEDHIEENGTSLQELNGWDKPTTDAYTFKQKSEMYEGIVRKWAIDDPEVARLSFDVNKDNIDPTRHDELDALVSKNQTNQKAKEATDDIMINHPDDERAALEEANKIEDADVSAKAKDDIRTRFADNKRIKENDRQALNDKQTKDIDIMLDSPQSSFEDIATYINKIEDGTDARAQKAYFRSEVKKQTDDVVTDNSKLTEYYANINKFKSLEHIRRTAGPTTSKSDMKDLENFWQSGGLLGGLSEGTLSSSFKLYSGIKAEENPLVYQSARRYIVNQVEALPPGRTKVSSTEIDEWMSQAVLKEADDNNFFTPDVPGLTLSQKLELGTAGTLTVEMTDEEEETVRALIIEGNEKRVAEGKAPFPLTDKFIQKGFQNLKGIRLPRPVAPNIVAPTPTPDTPPAPSVVETPAPEPQETIEPFRGAETAQTPAQIQESSAATGTTLSDREAIVLAAGQYPRGLQKAITNVLELSGVSEEQRRGMIDSLVQAAAIGPGFEAPTREAEEAGEALPDEELPTEKEFRDKFIDQLRSEGFDFNEADIDKVNESIRRAFEDLKREKGAQ